MFCQCLLSPYRLNLVKARYPLCSLPLAYKDQFGQEGPNEARWAALRTLGAVLDSGGQSVRAVVFDNHASQDYIKMVLVGRVCLVLSCLSS